MERSRFGLPHAGRNADGAGQPSPELGPHLKGGDHARITVTVAGSPWRWILGEHPYCDPPIPVRRGRGGRADLPGGGWARGLFAPVLAFPDHDGDGKPVWAGDAVAWAVRSSRGSGRAGLLRGGWRRRAWRLPRRGDARGRRCRPAGTRGQAACRGRAHQDQGGQRAQAEQGRERQDQGAAEEHGYQQGGAEAPAQTGRRRNKSMRPVIMRINNVRHLMMRRLRVCE